jgi:LDH2 family malate/lactate/ureidoglycolate dehydrogenase
LPGDPEQASENDRRKNGIPLDDVTWQQIVFTAKNLDIHL